MQIVAPRLALQQLIPIVKQHKPEVGRTQIGSIELMVPLNSTLELEKNTYTLYLALDGLCYQTMGSGLLHLLN